MRFWSFLGIDSRLKRLRVTVVAHSTAANQEGTFSLKKKKKNLEINHLFQGRLT